MEEDAKLLDVVTQLVEYPVALRGNFDSKYLELPKELLEMTMKHHQKYFPLVDKDGRLMPHFITISNVKADNPEAIQRGNERVLRARLDDARFFFEEDRKRKLDEFVDELKGVVFQKALGTSFEKVTRFTALAKKLAQTVCPEKETPAARCALLCKADLVSQMVYEFPELQGIMGGYYAALSGEDAEVAAGIKEHYRPAFAGDRLPETETGALVAVCRQARHHPGLYRRRAAAFRVGGSLRFAASFAGHHSDRSRPGLAVFPERVDQCGHRGAQRQGQAPTRSDPRAHAGSVLLTLQGPFSATKGILMMRSTRFCPRGSIRCRM